MPPALRTTQTVCNRFIRWSGLGLPGRIFVELADGGGETEEPMIDAPNRQARRTAASLPGKGLCPGISNVRKAA